MSTPFSNQEPGEAEAPDAMRSRLWLAVWQAGAKLRLSANIRLHSEASLYPHEAREPAGCYPLADFYRTRVSGMATFAPFFPLPPLSQALCLMTGLRGPSRLGLTSDSCSPEREPLFCPRPSGRGTEGAAGCRGPGPWPRGGWSLLYFLTAVHPELSTVLGPEAQGMYENEWHLLSDGETATSAHESCPVGTVL